MNHIETATEAPFTNKWSLHLLLLALLITPVIAVAMTASGGDFFFLAYAVPVAAAYATVTSIAVNAVTTRRSVTITHGVTLALLVLGFLVAGPT